MRFRAKKRGFLSEKHSVFLNRNCGHDRYSKNGLYVSKVIDKMKIPINPLDKSVLTNERLLAIFFDKKGPNRHKSYSLIDAFLKMI